MSRAVLAPFEAYQKSRVTFVQTVAELATRPQNIEALQSAGMTYPFFQHLTNHPMHPYPITDDLFVGVMALLRPLLLDNVPSI
jgi:hypothetical protein